MTPEERDLIAGLFDRLRSADAPGKDQEADDFIRRRVTDQPTAPYLLVQTALVQENALKGAQSRITELERQVAEANARSGTGSSGTGAAGGSSFLSGLLGRSTSTPPPLPRTSSGAPPPPPPVSSGGGSSFNANVPPPLPNQGGGAPATYAQPPMTSAAGAAGTGGGSSFLRGALGTAAGVAGGALLFEGIQNLLGHHGGPFSSLTGGGGGGFSGFGGNQFGGSQFGGGGFFGGAGHPETVERNETINNYYGSPGGSGIEAGNQANVSDDVAAEEHGDSLMQSSEPVEDNAYAGNDDNSGGLTNSDMQDMGFDSGDAGNSSDSYADSGDYGGDSGDSGGGSDDSYV